MKPRPLLSSLENTIGGLLFAALTCSAALLLNAPVLPLLIGFEPYSHLALLILAAVPCFITIYCAIGRYGYSRGLPSVTKDERRKHRKNLHLRDRLIEDAGIGLGLWMFMSTSSYLQSGKISPDAFTFDLPCLLIVGLFLGIFEIIVAKTR